MRLAAAAVLIADSREFVPSEWGLGKEKEAPEVLKRTSQEVHHHPGPRIHLRTKGWAGQPLEAGEEGTEGLVSNIPNLVLWKGHPYIYLLVLSRIQMCHEVFSKIWDYHQGEVDRGRLPASTFLSSP